MVNIRSIKLIASVPLELKEQFYQLQLKNSISRIRILGILFICIRLIEIPISGIVSLDYALLAIFILYNLSAYYFSHKNNSYRLLWAICYLFVFFYSIIIFWGMVATQTYTDAPMHILPLLSIIILLPDFQPKIFISFLIIPYTVLATVIMYFKELFDNFSDNIFFMINMFLIIIVIKILLYNSDVHKFIYTSKINELNKKLEGLSTTDELTKLNNRRSFSEYIEIIWKQHHRLHLPVTLLMVDVDYFKKYNDSLGHLEGDKALIAIAQCLKNHIKRETDFVARFGGEEFVCLLPFVAKDEAVNFAETLVENVENMQIHHPMSEHSKYVTISVGMASIVPDDNNSYTQLLDEADKALYTAKELGRNRVVFN